jgi:hypothetical protein
MNPHEIFDGWSDWIPETRLVDAGPKRTLGALKSKPNLPERWDTKGVP